MGSHERGRLSLILDTQVPGTLEEGAYRRNQRRERKRRSGKGRHQQLLAGSPSGHGEGMAIGRDLPEEDSLREGHQSQRAPRLQRGPYRNGEGEE